MVDYRIFGIPAETLGAGVGSNGAVRCTGFTSRMNVKMICMSFNVRPVTNDNRSAEAQVLMGASHGIKLTHFHTCSGLVKKETGWRAWLV